MNSQRQDSRKDWQSGHTVHEIDSGSLQRLADVGEWFRSWSSGFRVCDGVEALKQIASGRLHVTVRHEWVIRIALPRRSRAKPKPKSKPKPESLRRLRREVRTQEHRGRIRSLLRRLGRG